MRKKKLGQTTLEYAIIIAVVVAALLAIQIYMKRAVEGKVRADSDRIGEQFATGNTSTETRSSTDTGATTVQTIADGETMVTTTGTRTTDHTRAVVDNF